jgi:nucleotide-binding universal stress UspA family protein
MREFMKTVNNESDYNNISFQVLTGPTAEESLNDYIIKGEDADMIVLSTHARGWIDWILEKSFTKHVALRDNVPMMVFHYDKKEIAVEKTS